MIFKEITAIADYSMQKMQNYRFNLERLFFVKMAE